MEYFGILLTACLGILGLHAHSRYKQIQHLKANADDIRESTLESMERYGYTIDDFPKHRAALEGETYLKDTQVVDILYTCKTAPRRDNAL